MHKQTVIVTTFLFLIIFTASLHSDIRAVWVPLWEITTLEKADTVFIELSKHNVNQILLQVRYRGDAGYFPNRYNNFYPNPEKRYHALEDSLFDPLDYFIKKGRAADMEVHAWFTVFVITGHDLTVFDSTHVYFSNPDWVTTDYSQTPMNYELLEGAFFDLGIPAVQNYTFNVLMDIVANYDIDGVHLDYIRYPGQDYGYNKQAVEKYKQDIKLQDAKNWQNWKEKQVNNFVQKVYDKVKAISEHLQITAAVLTDPDDAREYYSQNWLEWLEQGFIDKVYLMAYTTSTSHLEKQLTCLSNLDMNDKIVVGLKSWSESKKYPAYEINEKIKLTGKFDFAGYALFSYSGIRQSEYFKELKMK